MDRDTAKSATTAESCTALDLLEVVAATTLREMGYRNVN